VFLLEVLEVESKENNFEDEGSQKSYYIVEFL